MTPKTKLHTLTPTSKISKAQYNKLLASGCKQSFFLFVKTFWHTFINEKPVWNWHIKYLCEQLQKVGEDVRNKKPCAFDYFIINVPPGTSKSSIVSVLYPLWCWSIDPTQRFICGSYSGTVSEDLADKCRKVFTSELYTTLFPYVGVRSDAKTKLENGNNAERYTVSTGSFVTGVHAHQIIIDDPLNVAQATSDIERENANRWINETLSTRKVDKRVSATIIIMQRLHEDDCTGFLLKKNLKLKHICLPAELDENVYPVELKENYIDGLLDPVRLDRDVLEKFQESLGSYGYAGQFQQSPVDLKGGLFKKEWFEIVTEESIYQNATVSGESFYKIIKFQLDTAYTTKEHNDPTGVLGYFKKGNDVFITNWTAKRLEFPQLCKFIQAHVREHGYTHRSLVRVEPKASGLSIIQQLKEETDLNVVESENPTKDKLARATEITAKCEAGRVKLIKGNWNEAFLNEVCGFPKAKHDEAVDCLTETIRCELILNEGRGLSGYDLVGVFF